MAKRTFKILTFLISLSWSSCVDKTEPPHTPPPDYSIDTLIAPTDKIIDTLFIEGSAELIQLNRFETPPEYPLQFATYYPTEFLVRSTGQDESDSVRFITNYSGVPDDSAYIQFTVLPATFNLQDAYEAARETAGMMGTIKQQSPHLPGAITEYAFRGAEKSGFISVGERNNRFFWIRATYPLAYAEGFMPRIDLMFEHFRWLDRELETR